MKATTRDLRLRTADLLSATDRGERVIITYRGKCRAVLSRWSDEIREPVQTTDPAGTHNPAFGLWRDRDEDVPAQVRDLRQRRKLP